MKKLRLLLWLSCFSLLSSTFAQSPTATLAGQLFDAKTGEPLPFATVYINNSTRGTTADENGRYRLTGLPLGVHELVGSMLGHTTARQTLRLAEARTYTVDLKLESSGNELGAVTVAARRTNANQRQIRQFSRELLGDRPSARQTRIINIDALRFTDEKGHFVVSATEPLVIENGALGYRLHYTLLHFDLYKGRMDFAGDCRFEELKPANSQQLATWQANRLKAYHGSLHHLLASLLRGTHEAEGFMVYQTPLVMDGSAGGTQAMPLVLTPERQMLDATRAMALFRPGELPFERQMTTTQPLEVYYNRTYARNSPYNDSPYAYSLLLLPNKTLDLTTDGWVTRGNGLDVRGYLGTDRLATLLPEDWVPNDKQFLDEVAITSGRKARSAPRLDSLVSSRQGPVSHQAPLVFVHTDKTIYSTGDQLWLSAYMLDALRQLPLIENTPPLQIELVAPDNQRIAHQWLTVKEGRATGSLRLSDTLQAGTYRLRAYTGLDGVTGGPAFESELTVQNIRLPGGRTDAFGGGAITPTSSAAGVLDVQLLPEGGRWLAGVPARLGIRVVQPDGRGRAVSGRLVDGADTEVSRFTTNAQGLGLAQLTPQPGERYMARLDGPSGASGVTVNLPPVESEGWSLAADALSDSARLLVTVRAAGRFREQPVYVTVQHREQLVYRQQWQLSRGEARFSLSLADMPPGVSRLTLWDTAGQPRAERLVFVAERGVAMQMRVSTARPRFAPRETVGIGLQFRDAENYPVVAIWSAAVTDADQVPADTSGPDVRTHLLLTSWLRGRVENPDRYLLPENASDLDLLLLTQGWRRLPAPTADSTGGWSLSGRVEDSRGRPLANETVRLLLENKGRKLMRSLTTDAKGHFSMDGLLLADTVQVRASTPKAPGAIVRFAEASPAFVTRPAPAPRWPTLARYTTDASVRQTEWPALYRDSTARQLAEVIVRASRSVAKDERPVEVARASLHSEADGTLIVEGNDRTLTTKDIWELLRMVPGIRLLKRGPMVGNSTPLFIIDGVYADADMVDLLDPRMVTRVEILKNPTTAGMYGARAATGVIAIYTRKGARETVIPEPTGPPIQVMGLATPREYYVPRYDLPQVATHTDRRDVLFWEPLGQSDQNGQGRLVFPLSDTARRLRVVVQGISNEGVPIHYVWVLPVR